MKLPITQKRCSGCHEIKDYTQYGEDTAKFDGFSAYCRDCKKIKNSEYKFRLTQHKKIARYNYRAEKDIKKCIRRPQPYTKAEEELLYYL